MKIGNTGREVMAALILLAAMSIFIDFRVEGTKAARWAEESLHHEKAHGVSPLKRLNDMQRELEELRVIVDKMAAERSSGHPNEALDTPGKQGAQ